MEYARWHEGALNSSALPPVSQDAVIVVPGIMGSALYDTTAGRRIWGLDDPRWLHQAWRRRGGMLPLHLDTDERAGRYGRVRPDGLLAFPAWAPFLQGFEPYTALLAAVREVVADRAAVLPFAYDWRLPVAVNGALLAEAARRHLGSWRAHSVHDAARRLQPDERPAQLVFVAHSMGGLVVRAAMAHDGGLAGDTRTVITLGTPFYGSAKAAVALGGDRGSRLPSRLLGRMRALAASLPGVHDLLPDYRCVDEGLDVRRLTPADVAAIGGDRNLAASAQLFQRRMREQPLPEHRAVVGVAQPTVQSLVLDSGVVQPQHRAFDWHRDGELVRDANGVPRYRDRAGDGTVYRDAGSLGGPAVTALPAQHGGLPRNSVVLTHVQAIITERDADLGSPLGGGEFGLTAPDEAHVGEPWTLRLTGADSPAGRHCYVYDAVTGRRVAMPRLDWCDGQIAATVVVSDPGLYRVAVDAGGSAPVTQLVLVMAPGDEAEEDGGET